MRRTVALVLILTAFICLAAWLRPRRILHPHIAAAAPQVQLKAEDKEEEPIETAASSPAPAPMLKPNPPPPPRGKTIPIPERQCMITILDVAGEVVPGATVLILTHSYGRPSAETKVTEARTDGAGLAAFGMGMHDTADVFAYKVGVGAGASAPIKTQADATVQLKASPDLDVSCLGVHNVPLEGAEVVLITEVLYPGKLDAYGSRTLFSFALPSRKLLTQLDGSGRFETVFPLTEVKEGWRERPGIRLRLTAEWNRLTAKVTLDKPLDGPVLLYPE